MGSILIPGEPALVVMVWNGTCTGAEPSRDGGHGAAASGTGKVTHGPGNQKGERTLKHIYLSKAPLDAVAIFH